jgi:hypothetical protein
VRVAYSREQESVVFSKVAPSVAEAAPKDADARRRPGRGGRGKGDGKAPRAGLDA